MQLRSLGDKSASTPQDVARIFMKPGVWRHRLSLGAAATVLRPLTILSKAQPRVALGQVHRILIFEPGALGDMVLLTPFLHALRAHLSQARITLVGRADAGELLLESGLIDEWIPVQIPWAADKPRWKVNIPFSPAWLSLLRTVFQLRKSQFDLAFAAGWNCDLRSNFLLWLAGARRRVGYGYVGGDFLLTDVVQPDLEHPHVVERGLHLLEHIGVPVLRHDEGLRIAPEDQRDSAELLARHGIVSDDLVIGIHPGAGSPIREWGFERFAEIAHRMTELFGAKVLWFSDPAKPGPVPAELNIVPLALPFRLFRAALPHCRLFVCNDSGPMHVAAALKVPVVAIFGAQRPEWFGPWGEYHRVVIRNDIWCRPCADHCLWKEPHCLRLISVAQVMEAITEAMGSLTDTKTSVDTGR